MFRTVFPSIIRSSRLYIQHQVYVIQVRWLLASMQSANLYDIYLTLYVQFWTPDDGRKDRPKHVEWYSVKSKIVHLIGFTIEIFTTLWKFWDRRAVKAKACFAQNCRCYSAFPSEILCAYLSAHPGKLKTPLFAYCTVLQQLPRNGDFTPLVLSLITSWNVLKSRYADIDADYRAAFYHLHKTKVLSGRLRRWT